MARAQSATTGRIEAGASYDWTRANAPAGQCVCFSLNGGTGTVAYNLTRSFGLLAEVGGSHANNLNGTTQSVTTYTYLAGARYAVPAGPRASLYGQALFGTTHEASNYTYVADKSAFTFGFGGGLHYALYGRLGLNLVQLDWLHSTLPNGSNDKQNDLRIGTGLYLRFGTR
jgi:peptidoglycan-associated lipoprotein